MKQHESHALHEVWEWKEHAAHEVEDLSIRDAVKKRLEDALRTTQALGIPLSNEINMARLPHASNQ